jgi:hypothetical protein
MGTLPIRADDWNLAWSDVKSLHFKVSLDGKPPFRDLFGEECFAT